MKLISEEDQDWLRQPENKLYFYLYVAYLEARKGGKRKTYDEHRFEVNEFDNLLLLTKTIMLNAYNPMRGTAHVIFYPVTREIFAAAFRDRVVHHFIYMMIYDWWDKHFIYDSYSCREDKGTQFGIERLQHHLRSASYNNTKEVWVLKFDVEGFFMNMNRMRLCKVALGGLKKQFKGHRGLMYHIIKICLLRIVLDDPVKGARLKGFPDDWENIPPTKTLLRRPKGVGIVIGNLTSQLLANIFLDQLDRYIKFTLGYKNYGRYVDDFYIIVTSEQLPKALKDIEAIRTFLRRIGLRLHPKKISIQPARNGVAFLGAVVYSYVVHPGKRLKKNIKKAFYSYAHGVRNEEVLVSYVGHVKCMKHYKFLCDTCESVGLPREFWMRFEKGVSDILV